MSMAAARESGLKGTHFLDFSGWTAHEMHAVLALANELKQKRAKGEPTPYLQGKTLAMLFDKASTRTRVSFEVGMYELGGHALFLSNQMTQVGRGEPLADTARVLSRYVQGIMVRTHAHANVEELARYSTVPVINGLTDDHHPVQVLADFMTILEHKGRLRGLTLCYVGDGNNMAHSLLQAAALVGMHIRIASPHGYEPRADIVQQARRRAMPAHSEVTVTEDPYAAAKGADVIYTDVFTSMGQEQEAEKRLLDFAGFQVNQELLGLADQDAIFMHCLPAHRGEEVTEEVLEGAQSVVFDQAENRLHAQKALLVALMSDHS
ncbi:ornithine carbamoyltransferase [Sulfoacidibacillus thermotolerans]|uniref:Ornithine carbamoyltransferase n=1 Tax=Sulfoacidibacillus thermotolerans TaxID=1765684 RepID=A0A2U3D8P8_SULT2|nr:ornithine carbamoyltransferase [Sulfoacidibacillus thermotolerans]PWI57648.1 ornithine carbamoyltransferase [Sulfoacidibacillus thermotolerans]